MLALISSIKESVFFFLLCCFRNPNGVSYSILFHYVSLPKQGIIPRAFIAKLEAGDIRTCIGLKSLGILFSCLDSVSRVDLGLPRCCSVFSAGKLAGV